MSQSYLIFHLNLAFSSIPVEAHPEVIKKCYWPLLKLVRNTGIPAGIELTGWTLKQIVGIDPAWIDCFRDMLAKKECELIGSGWTQLIGPLAPYKVNYWNQQLGLSAYKEILGITPSLALVNEMAYSTSMVDIYIEAGYRAIIMDKDNIRLALSLTEESASALPTHAQGSGSDNLPVLWSDSILFQRLQRAVHGDIPISEYLDYVRHKQHTDQHPLAIYSNDAEIFDYRPGRFTTEGKTHSQGEWNRLEQILLSLKNQLQLNWQTPSAIVASTAQHSQPNPGRLTSIFQPLPVKKQAKYNINRWALAGRNNMWLNSQCHEIYHNLVKQGINDQHYWQKLCELWASDLRTHITESRWLQALQKLNHLQQQLIQAKSLSQAHDDDFQPVSDIALLHDISIKKDPENIYWTIKTPHIELVLNTRRGLTIKSLSFASQQFQPFIVTLNQGHFDNIQLGADFYSGGMIVETPEKRSRSTDLEWVNPSIEENAHELRISAQVHLDGHTVTKAIILSKSTEQVKLAFLLSKLPRPVGSVRLAILTLNTDAFPMPYGVLFQNGGQHLEHYEIRQEFDHSQAVSPLVSSSCSLGSTGGKVLIGNKQHAVELQWDPAKCAAVPMLLYRKNRQKDFVRILFSQSELDDTFKPGGNLLDFTLQISPASLPVVTGQSIV